MATQQADLLEKTREQAQQLEQTISRLQESQAQLVQTEKTTKPVGKGTGLGLSISYQIVVDKHGGTFECQSQPRRGTEFEIAIPIRSSDRISAYSGLSRERVSR